MIHNIIQYFLDNPQVMQEFLEGFNKDSLLRFFSKNHPQEVNDLVRGETAWGYKDIKEQVIYFDKEHFIKIAKNLPQDVEIFSAEVQGYDPLSGQILLKGLTPIEDIDSLENDSSEDEILGGIAPKG